MKIVSWVLPLYILISTNVSARDRVVNLVVEYKTINFAGKQKKAIAVNNQIPAPTLHFNESDHVTINVYNKLDKATAIHWHGVLVPWKMDGVLGVTQHGIPPGGIFRYRFTLFQSGTYWYHAHAGSQEQQGLYGAFLIEPLKTPSYSYHKDYVIVLSDWINTQPDQVLSNLKKDGDYYSPNFPLQPSLAKFIHDYRKSDHAKRKMLLDDYKMMQQMRMSIYDISDIAYDAFLLNGKPNATPWRALVKKGDHVRLRFIGAGADTIFHVKIPGVKMKMVHVQGNDVKPYSVDDFTIAPGETYDVLVSIKQEKPTIIYAEAKDKVGAAYGALVTSRDQTVNYSKVTPFSEPLPVTQEMMVNGMISEMGHGSHSMNMQTEPTLTRDRIISIPAKPLTFGTKYQHLTSAVKTNDPGKPIAGVIKMELFGYMGRFIWLINGLPEYAVKPIKLEPGKRYRLIFTNPSMMHHPMHIHQHWFILRNGHGAYDPLLHTIDVPPGSTVTTDVDADASGNSFFHCHLLYHMLAGMSRVFQYSTLIEITDSGQKPENTEAQTRYANRPIVRVDERNPVDHSLVKNPMAHSQNWWFANLLDVDADPFNNIQHVSFKGLYGSDYNKLEFWMNDAEVDHGKVSFADMDVFYWHLFDQFWAVKGGFNYSYLPVKSSYWQPGIGIEGLMPYFINTDIRTYYYAGSAKLDIEFSRDTQITNNFLIRLGVRSIFATKTAMSAAIGSGLNQARYIVRPYYRLMPGLNVFAEYENERYFGAFKNIMQNVGKSTGENTLSFGFSVLF